MKPMAINAKGRLATALRSRSHGSESQTLNAVQPTAIPSTRANLAGRCRRTWGADDGGAAPGGAGKGSSKPEAGAGAGRSGDLSISSVVNKVWTGPSKYRHVTRRY